MINDGYVKRIIIIDDSAYKTELGGVVQEFGFSVEYASGPEEYPEQHDDNISDLFIIVLGNGGADKSIELANRILSRKTVPLIFLLEKPDDELLKLTERAANYGFLTKNSDAFTINSVINNAFTQFYKHQSLVGKLRKLQKPLNDESDVVFSDLFNVDELQRIQDQFAEATGVASLITAPDGSPITKPSSFTRLCNDIVRTTEIGRKNCYKSDAVIGRHNPDGPVVHACLSCGLLDAGATISVGGKHLASWLIGQIRTEDSNNDDIIKYADEIGVPRKLFKEALDEVPFMSADRFNRVSEFLFSLANDLSIIAYQNLQQARFINERNIAEARLKETNRKLKLALQSSKMGTLDWDQKSGKVILSKEVCDIFGIKTEEFPGTFDAYLAFSLPEEREELKNRIQNFMDLDLNTELIKYDHRILAKDGAEKWISFSGTLFPDEKSGYARLVGIVSDITAQKTNEQMIVQASEEKELFLRDLKHRMKNSLAIISGLLSLEMRRLDDSDKSNPELMSFIEETITRIDSINQIYEQFSELQNMNSIELVKFITEIVNNFAMSFAVNGNEIRFISRIDSIEVAIKRAMNIGLILNELLTNAVKYAYPEDTPGVITVSLDIKDNQLSLTVADKGKGLKQDFSDRDKGTGIQIIELLTMDISGEFVLRGDDGTTAILNIALARGK